VSDEKTAPKNAVVIKKYANRRLYNTATSTYVTLDDLSSMVKSGTDFVVFDAKTGEDITRSVLTQIIFEEENKGTNLLPINFLRQLIRYYGDSMQTLVPGYLEFSLENLTKEHDKIREQMMSAFGGEPFKNMEEHAKRNMALFADAMKLFNPFAAMAMNPGAGPAPAKPNSAGTQTPSKDDLQAMKDQLTAMQEKINTLAKN
jgi:polyhydroxyalkanoate synthesis repressor PhaR